MCSLHYRLKFFNMAENMRFFNPFLTMAGDMLRFSPFGSRADDIKTFSPGQLIEIEITHFIQNFSVNTNTPT